MVGITIPNNIQKKLDPNLWFLCKMSCQAIKRLLDEIGGQMGNGKNPHVLISCHWHCYREPTVMTLAVLWPPTRLPFYQLLPQEESSHYNLYPAGVQVCPSRHNHCPRQPLNEDRFALLSHCILTKLSVVFVCWLPSYVSILPSSQNRLAVCQKKEYTQLARGQFVEILYSGERMQSVIVHFSVPNINFAKAGGCHLLHLPSIWLPVHIWIIMGGSDCITFQYQSGGNLNLLCSFALTIFTHLKVHNLFWSCCDIATDGSINTSTFY